MWQYLEIFLVVTAEATDIHWADTGILLKNFYSAQDSPIFPLLLPQRLNPAQNVNSVKAEKP